MQHSTFPDREECVFKSKKDVVGHILQTLLAMLFSSYFFYFPVVVMFLGTLVWTGYLSSWSVAVFSGVYCLNLATSKVHLENGWPRLSNWFMYQMNFCDLVLHYYNGTWVREGPRLDPKKRYMFAHWPHGIFGVCRAFSGGSGMRTMFPGITARWGSFGKAFYIPGVREFSLIATCIDASKPVVTRAVEEYDNNIMLLPGGIQEMQLTDPNSKVTKLVGPNRKGYAKMAIRMGMDIVPGFCFGEKWVHDKMSLPDRVCLWLNKNFQISGTFPKGRWCTFLGFVDRPLNFVHGAAIPVRQMDEPSDEYLDNIHQQVCRAVEDIFERYKSRFGYDDDERIEWVDASVRKGRKGRKGSKKKQKGSKQN